MSLTSETVNNSDNEEEQEEKYCVCRGPYGNKFMIACDGCEEWFHGSCISINSDQAKNVDKYFCPFCKEKDPTLKTIFKAKNKDRDRERQKEKEKRHKEKMKRREEKKKRDEKRSKHSLNSDSEEEGTPAKKIKPETSIKKKEHRDSGMSKEELKKLKRAKEEQRMKFAREEARHKEKHKERNEVNEKTSDETNIRKPSSESVRSEESVKFKIPKEEEPVKSKTVKIKEESPSLAPPPEEKKKEKKREEIRLKPEEPKERKEEERKPKVEIPEPKPSKMTPPVKPPKNSPPPEKPSKPSESDDDADFNSFLSSLSKKTKAPVVSSSEDEDVDVGMVEVVDTKKPTKTLMKEPPSKTVKPASGQGKKKVLKKKGRPKKQIGSNNGDVVGAQYEKESSEEEEKQCLGPGCCNAARSRSRYCSDDCGVKLAVKRIKTFLPERKEALNEGGTAKRFDEEQISDLEQQQTVAHQKILELQNQRLVIMNLIKKAKETILDNNSEEDFSEEETTADNEEVDCVICGMACTDKNAVRHMERCYNKFESKLGLGSTVKCHVTWESPVCDAYDRQQGTYCKKLRVLCPDHNKEKEEHDGICGCPLDLSEISEEGSVCHKGKRACNKHTGWEKLRLAEIDMERVLQDLKLEDSFEEMRKVKYRMAYRSNLLQILLNGTINHTIPESSVT